MASSLLMQHQILCCDSWSVHRPSLMQRRIPGAVQVKAEKSSSSSRKGESLWRSELSSSSSWSEDWRPESAEEEEKEVAEAERQMRRKAQEDEKGGVGVMAIVGSVVEKLLIADFFFILFILVWFLAGLAEKAAFDTSALIDAWLPLWSPLFQPALGFFMTGSLWTAVSKNLLKR